MDLVDIRFLYGFDRWATTKVLDAAVGVGRDDLVGDEHRRPSAVSVGSWSTSSAPSSAGVIS